MLSTSHQDDHHESLTPTSIHPHSEIPTDPDAERIFADEEKTLPPAARRSTVERSHPARPLKSPEARNDLDSLFLRMLPSEIISEIFFFAVSQSPSQKIGKQLNPFSLGSVCSSWRTIAWSYPVLWSSVSARINGRLSFVVELLEQWLSRSGDLPLSIRIFDEGYFLHDPRIEDLFGILNRYAHRWRIADLNIHSSYYLYLPLESTTFPLLESLAVATTASDMHNIGQRLTNTPQLRELTISSFRLGHIKFQWDTLTRLTLHSFPMFESLEILRQTQQLVYFTLRHVSAIARRNTSAQRPVLLACLQSLQIQNSIAVNLWPLLNHIISPKLGHLAIHDYDKAVPTPMPLITSLIASSACSLDILTVSLTLVDDEHLLQLFSSLTSLRMLCIHTTNDTMTDELLELIKPHKTDGSCLLPRLEALEYRGPLSFTWPSLFSMLESRYIRGTDEQTDAKPGGLHGLRNGRASVTCIRNVSLRFFDSIGSPLVLDDESFLTLDHPDLVVYSQLERTTYWMHHTAVVIIVACDQNSQPVDMKIGVDEYPSFFSTALPS
ncbi:hypothetical protein B0H34DRAFT_8494 [Crassisporium funariophilum]|nr:hypothetical protein B0H34DRAFT_8494 [Crassisporium funariophilum]